MHAITRPREGSATFFEDKHEQYNFPNGLKVRCGVLGV